MFNIDAGFSLPYVQISAESLIAGSCGSGTTGVDSMGNTFSKENRDHRCGFYGDTRSKESWGTCQTREM